MTQKFLLFFLIIFLLVGRFSYVSAQSDSSIMLNPKNPEPYSPVTLTLVSYAFDVNQATITWSLGNKQLLKGVGEKTLKVQTGGVGERLPIHVSVVTSGGDSVGLDVDIVPESVSILFEAEENYVPLFYEGLSLPGEESVVRFIAMPNMSDGGAILPPSSISYFWYVDDNFIDSASGIGRQSATLKLDTLSDTTDIRVVAHTPGGTVAEKTITMYPHAVVPLLYTYDEILGANHSTLVSKRFEATKDFTLILEPFFLSLNKSLGSTVSYEWLLDGLPVTPLGGRMLTLHPKENNYGSEKLSISISNTKRRLQKGITDVSLIFDTRK